LLELVQKQRRQYIFIIFAENFKTMKLSKDQKNLLKGGLAAWAGMVVAMVLFAVFGKRTWSDTLWLVLGVTIAEIIVGLFLVLGSRVPKKKDENQ
jgi:prolipoprotein diacylglyceryltransferase